MLKNKDFFKDKRRSSRVLIGCSINSGSPRIAELAAKIGFDVVWIEMEHASADLSTAEAMCVATEAGGGIPLIRTIGCRREHILHALEIGGRIIVIPFVNDAQTAQEVVIHGKFRPLGQRGYNTRSRAMAFGIDSQQMMVDANEETCLLPQIESLEAVENLDEILDVEGLGGIFVGPGDISADIGCPSKFDDPKLCKIICKCIEKTRAKGLRAGILVGNGPLLDSALRAGADLCIITSDMGAVIDTWSNLVRMMRQKRIKG